MIIKERDLRQAIQEGLGQWKVDPQHAALFETAIMQRVDDYKEQPISFKEIKEVEELGGAATPGPWLYDERVGCVAVYPGEQVNCMSDLDDDRKVYYKHGYWVDGGNGGHWEVEPQKLADARFISESRTLLPQLAKRLKEAVYE